MLLMAKLPDNWTMAFCASFAGGINSGTLPSLLPDGTATAAMNLAHRGDVWQTRPGYNTTFGMPCGQPQGIVFFTPTGGTPYLVIAVAGLVYTSRWANGFNEYQLLPNVKFSPNVTNVFWAVTSQFSSRDSGGNVIYLQQPVSVLMMQDGVSRAAYWDGENSGHLNPTPSDKSLDTSPAGFDGTPQGEWMAWAGNRLWVAFGNQVFASDFGNPLKFKESEYIADGQSFYMPEGVTGMIQPTVNSPLFIFGPNTNTRLQANIQDRSQWLYTPEFQITDYTIGCVAGRSIVLSHGFMWWYSAQGVANFNAATQQHFNSSWAYQDSQMAFSKYYLAANKVGICALPFENYLLFSVPSSDRWNAHTWALDLLPSQTGGGVSAYSAYQASGAPGWDGIWTGTRPVEWTTGIINGQQYCWFLSFDYDKVNRVWQAFDGTRTDNGCPITSYLQTKAHNFNSLDYKRFVYADMNMLEVLGDYDLSVSFASEKGAYQRVMTKRVVATPGMFGTVQAFSTNTTYQSYRPQTRFLATENNNNRVSECNFCGIESNKENYVGREFSLLFVMSGRGGIKNYRCFVQVGLDDKFKGDCEVDETGPRVLTDSGCSTDEDDTANTPFPLYADAETATVYCPSGESGNPSIGSAYRTSIISELDANKKAECAAFQDALAFLRCLPVASILTESGGNMFAEDGSTLILE